MRSRKKRPGSTGWIPTRIAVGFVSLLAALMVQAPTVAQTATPTATQSAAQTGAPATAETGTGSGDLFFDRVDVNVVNVEVYVTDKDGNPVTGLTREDFELYQDGKPVEISNFYAIEGGDPAPVRMNGAEVAVDAPGAAANGDSATRAATRPATRPATEPAPAPSTAPPREERRLNLVVYVDQLAISPSSRNRVLEGLELFLEERLTRGDRVMVVSSYPAFQVVQPFTQDRQKVLDAVRDVQKRSASGLFQDRRVVETQLSRAADVADPVTLDLMRRTTLQSIRQYMAKASQQLGAEIRKLQGFVGSLAGLPGRTAILHLSDGIPVRPAEDLFALWESVFAAGGEGATRDYSGRLFETRGYELDPYLHDLVEEANTHDVTFYTLEAGGRSFSAVDASVRGMTSTGDRFGGSEITSIADTNAQQTLLQIAGETGGVPIVNANQPWVALERMASTFDTYYSLGYMPPEDQPGKYHNLEVKVLRDGLRVRHREGYREETTEDRIENATVAALLLGRWSNPLRAYLDVGKPRPQKKKKRFEVPVEINVPLERVTLLAGPKTHRGLLRVRVAFQGSDGVGFGVGDEMKVPIEIPNEDLDAARSRHFTVLVRLELDPGLHRLAVGVWDEVASQASFLPYDVFVDKG